MLSTEATTKKLLIHSLSQQFVVQNSRSKIIVILHKQDNAALGRTVTWTMVFSKGFNKHQPTNKLDSRITQCNQHFEWVWKSHIKMARCFETKTARYNQQHTCKMQHAVNYPTRSSHYKSVQSVLILIFILLLFIRFMLKWHLEFIECGLDFYKCYIAK